VAATGPEPIGLPPGASVLAAGEDEAKYSSHNVVVQKLIARLLRELRVAAGSTSGTWVDVGIGEGLALEAMEVRAGSLVGVEYRQDKLAMALQRLPTASGVRADAGMLPFTDHSADIVTCLEVLEHLGAPERAVGELARVCHGHCVVSVPWEPFFRLGNLCRGKDVRRWGDNPEHVQHFRPSTLRALLRRSFAEVDVRPCFPWIIAVATPAAKVGNMRP
jgi:2-polyprenyl-3-methyl-5-hydroxy-6-metoxy-1,4-benzoquinol methylase